MQGKTDANAIIRLRPSRRRHQDSCQCPFFFHISEFHSCASSPLLIHTCWIFCGTSIG
ncbi:hypothetical protein JHK82_016238 [Glycine max]|uniref:Uncharacterized protein n=2 Tax=Glycine subgen. Soja TaxID=1462606 RepID=K7KWW7_SOYBN|nr:hypothetical protein JHK85_016646 [Glycine max]RZC08874.1 hypothetical protein D0Y65_015543 [Glycine soja]KAG5046870.1 hypothetical protein JHK86_016276 [Glycine max]KAG5149357.1 hypothetical protein JHK82_016238 [Glycine max]KAH1127301.1 hypothetical protein GYH30_016035 [Glycine max]